MALLGGVGVVVAPVVVPDGMEPWPLVLDSEGGRGKCGGVGVGAGGGNGSDCAGGLGVEARCANVNMLPYPSPFLLRPLSLPPHPPPFLTPPPLPYPGEIMLYG